MLTFCAAKFTPDLKLPANLITSCSSHVATFYSDFYSETVFCSGFEESEAKRSPWVKIKKKPGLFKEDEQGQSLNVQRKQQQKKKKFSWQRAVKVCGTTSLLLFENRPRRKISGRVE